MFPIKQTQFTPYGRPIPDQYVMERKENYLHLDDECIRPGGCNGTLRPIAEVVGWNRKGHDDWLMCDQCGLRYKPLDRHGYIWADNAYYGYVMEYSEGGGE